MWRGGGKAKMRKGESVEMAMEDGSRMQHVIVMRHGERLDDVDGEWVRSADRPWDPPLTERGKRRARVTGKQLRAWNITRLLCSPFLRCVQTAAEVLPSLCLQDADSSSGHVIDPPRVKVSLEYGLVEVMDRIAIRVDNIPEKGPSTLDFSDLYALLPLDTVDLSVQPIWPKLPEWRETIVAAHTRYSTTIEAAANMFPGENILLVTHGEGVGVSVSMRIEARVYGVDYCGYSHAQRPIYSFSSESFEAGPFDLLNKPGEFGLLF